MENPAPLGPEKAFLSQKLQLPQQPLLRLETSKAKQSRGGPKQLKLLAKTFGTP
jgi:hypothetical protein